MKLISGSLDIQAQHRQATIEECYEGSGQKTSADPAALSATAKDPRDEGDNIGEIIEALPLSLRRSDSSTLFPRSASARRLMESWTGESECLKSSHGASTDSLTTVDVFDDDEEEPVPGGCPAAGSVSSSSLNNSLAREEYIDKFKTMYPDPSQQPQPQYFDEGPGKQQRRSSLPYHSPQKVFTKKVQRRSSLDSTYPRERAIELISPKFPQQRRPSLRGQWAVEPSSSLSESRARTSTPEYDGQKMTQPTELKHSTSMPSSTCNAMEDIQHCPYPEPQGPLPSKRSFNDSASTLLSSASHHSVKSRQRRRRHHQRPSSSKKGGKTKRRSSMPRRSYGGTNVTPDPLAEGPDQVRSTMKKQQQIRPSPALTAICAGDYEASETPNRRHLRRKSQTSSSDIDREPTPRPKLARQYLSVPCNITAEVRPRAYSQSVFSVQERFQAPATEESKSGHSDDDHLPESRYERQRKLEMQRVSKMSKSDRDIVGKHGQESRHNDDSSLARSWYARQRKFAMQVASNMSKSDRNIGKHRREDRSLPRMSLYDVIKEPYRRTVGGARCGSSTHSQQPTQASTKYEEAAAATETNQGMIRIFPKTGSRFAAFKTCRLTTKTDHQ